MAIALSPDELRDLASQLKQNAADVIALANTISSNIDTGTSAWEGEAKKKYVSDFEEMKPTLTTKLPDLIDQMAASLENTATQFEDMDRTRAGG